ncbi:hypothetical protein ACFQ0G_53285 [Streptomyces chiangmaiensis]
MVRSVNGGPNFRLPFGPYTLTQLAAIVTSVGLLILSRPCGAGTDSQTSSSCWRCRSPPPSACGT